MIAAIRVIYIVLVLAFTALSDIKWHRIPNWLTLPSAVVGLTLWFIIAGTEGLKVSAIGLAVGFVAFLIPFMLSGMGGGDVKLMAAVGALIGWPLIIWAILLSCVVALFGTVAKAIWKGRFVKLLVNTWLLVKNMFIALILRRPMEEIKTVAKVQATVYVPFGAAIAVGTVWAMLLQYLIGKGVVGYLPYFLE